MAKQLQSFAEKGKTRRKLAQDIEAFLASGGSIKTYPSGYTESSVLNKRKISHLNLQGK